MSFALCWKCYVRKWTVTKFCDTGTGDFRFRFRPLHQTVSDYTIPQRFANTQQARFRTAYRCLEKLVLPSIFNISLTSFIIVTNRIDEVPLQWRHEPISIHQISVADTSCGKPPVYSCRRPRGSMFLYLRAEQTLSGLGTSVFWCWYWENCNSIENSSLNRQVQSCVKHPVGSIAIRTYCQGRWTPLLLQLVHRLWGLSTADHLHPRFGVLSWATITLSPVEQQSHCLEDPVCLELIRHKDGSVSV